MEKDIVILIKGERKNVMKKKLVSIFTVLLSVVLATIVFAQDTDYASLSDEELRGIIQSARDELDRRKTAEEGNTILYDKDGIQVYFTGESSYNISISDATYDILNMETIVINNSDKNISVSFSDCSINGWETKAGGVQDISAGKKKKDMVDFNLTLADITKKEEIDDIEYTLLIYDNDTYDDIDRVAISGL